jgi:hypothetical protein
MTEERTVNCLRQMEHIGGLGWLLFAFLEKPQYGIWANKGTSRRAEEHSLNPKNACIYIIHIQFYFYYCDERLQLCFFLLCVGLHTDYTRGKN